MPVTPSSAFCRDDRLHRRKRGRGGPAVVDQPVDRLPGFRGLRPDHVGNQHGRGELACEAHPDTPILVQLQGDRLATECLNDRRDGANVRVNRPPDSLKALNGFKTKAAEPRQLSLPNPRDRPRCTNLLSSQDEGSISQNTLRV
jgi:hypothetical protein